jgi:hypothetical protein
MCTASIHHVTKQAVGGDEQSNAEKTEEGDRLKVV